MNAEDLTLPTTLSTRAGRIPALRRRLARRLRDGELTIMPGVTDPLAARLVERAGFAACYATGAGIANVQYGLPDIGLLGLEDVAVVVRRITDAVELPVVVDADTGFGSALSVMRTVHVLEAAGAAAIQLEDQVMPKRCGHFDRHSLIGADEMAAKIAAAVAARSDPDLLIVARTDARGVVDLDEALRRGHRYLDAGADALFVEAPRTMDELARIGAEFAGVPLVANVVEGGRTPQLPAVEYGELGFTLIMFANVLMRVMARAAQTALAALREQGDSRVLADAMLSWAERQDLVDLALFDGLDARWDPANLT